MRARVKAYLQEERGNAALFMIGLLSIMMVLFVFVFNLSKIFAVKEEANTTAQQASLAATSVLYDQLDEAIEKYESREIIGVVDSHPESIEEKIEKKEIQLRSDAGYNDYSENEIKLEAIDIVLTEELRHGLGKDKLDDILGEEIYQQTLPDMVSQAKSTIIQNDGNLTDATLTIKDGQVFVHASNTMEGTSFKGFFQDIKEDLFQTSAGPKVDFIEELSNFQNKEVERFLDE
ncbi:pilus assembly protein TadG-related protein [Rossellomorea sp. SC111]|uniref:Tad domain-containing protein n=1 Tax=Rossellomorea sp. SC111 TaxID=2968985 RepID=UPI00215B6FA6|nr:Tad domain-containing protein [Rossellomorea sp. SC111]MCR8850840.1 pilus assembly protein TadG-related protein [Rossellomorea sp. SC111]